MVERICRVLEDWKKAKGTRMASEGHYECALTHKECVGERPTTVPDMILYDDSEAQLCPLFTTSTRRAERIKTGYKALRFS